MSRWVQVARVVPVLRSQLISRAAARIWCRAWPAWPAVMACRPDWRCCRALAAEPPQVVPGGETADDLPFGGIADRRGGVPGPSFEVSEAFVPGRQDASGHQDGAQMAGGAGGQVAVERVVSGRLAGAADLGEDRRGGGAAGQPVHQGDGVAGGQHVVDRLGVRVKAAVIVG